MPNIMVTDEQLAAAARWLKGNPGLRPIPDWPELNGFVRAVMAAHGAAKAEMGNTLELQQYGLSVPRKPSET